MFIVCGIVFLIAVVWIVRAIVMIGDPKPHGGSYSHSLPPRKCCSSGRCAPRATPHTASMTQPSSPDDGFSASMLVGMASNNAVLGGVIGGNMAGGIVGDMLNGGSVDFGVSHDSTPSYDSIPSYDSGSSFDGVSDFGGGSFE